MCYMINPFRGHGEFRLCFELEVNSATSFVGFLSACGVYLFDGYMVVSAARHFFSARD